MNIPELPVILHVMAHLTIFRAHGVPQRWPLSVIWSERTERKEQTGSGSLWNLLLSTQMQGLNFKKAASYKTCSSKTAWGYSHMQIARNNLDLITPAAADEVLVPNTPSAAEPYWMSYITQDCTSTSTTKVLPWATSSHDLWPMHYDQSLILVWFLLIAPVSIPLSLAPGVP